MSALLARTGRHKQRYENEFRLVSGCIPYRLKKGVEDATGDLEDRLEVLMISSPNRHDLVFPKGGWEDDENIFQAASREALEEAGVRGEIEEKDYLGVWEFRSKSRQNSCSKEGWCRGYMFAMEVTEELEYWPEQANHERRWVTVREAFKLCRYEWMREALLRCLTFLSSDKSHERMEVTQVRKVGSVQPAFSEIAEKTPNRITKLLYQGSVWMATFVRVWGRIYFVALVNRGWCLFG